MNDSRWLWRNVPPYLFAVVVALAVVKLVPSWAGIIGGGCLVLAVGLAWTQAHA